MSENRVLKRDEVDKSLTWALSDIFADDEAWEAAFAEAQSFPAKIAAFKGTLGDSAEQLYGCLKAEAEGSLLLEKLHGYASHHANEDMTNTNYQVMNSRMMSLFVQVSGAAAFISSEILAIPREKLEEFKQSEAADRDFDRTLELIEREREHTRSAEIEALLADTREMSRASSEIFSMFNNADTKFPEVPDGKGNMIELTHGRYVGLLENRDQSVRFLTLFSWEGYHSLFLIKLIYQLIYTYKSTCYLGGYLLQQYQAGKVLRKGEKVSFHQSYVSGRIKHSRECLRYPDRHCA